MDTSKFLIVGANGQLGQALSKKYPEAKAVDYKELDITDEKAVREFDWANITHILNAAAYTNVDAAETSEGRVSAWQINVVGVANLSKAAIDHDLTLLHISTDYVFDGTNEIHTEDEKYSPLGVYASTKAAADIMVGTLPKQYILRTSWVIGSGNNFVRSIYGLGLKEISPNVVADQFGRLTFTDELVRVIDHLLTTTPSYGTYNTSNEGDVASWADIARQIYKDADFSHLTVGDTTAEEYFAGKVSSPRPTHSALDLSKLKATGYQPVDWRLDLQKYIKEELSK